MFRFKGSIRRLMKYVLHSIVTAMVSMSSAFTPAFADQPASTSAVCIVIQPGPKTLKFYEDKYKDDFAVVLAEIEGGPEAELNLISKARKAAQAQEEDFKGRCMKKRPGKWESLWEDVYKVPECQAYFATTPWKTALDQRYYNLSLNIVKRNMRDAEAKQKTILLNERDQPGFDLSQLKNNNPEWRSLSEITTKLYLKRNELENILKTYREEITDSKDSPPNPAAVDNRARRVFLGESNSGFNSACIAPNITEETATILGCKYIRNK